MVTAAAGRVAGQAARGRGNGGNNGPVIRLPGPWELPGETISESSLLRMREEFWETRTSGHRGMWDALKLACEGLQQDPPDTNLAGAILYAADLRCPSGSLEEVYDTQGNLYAIPRFCYSRPTNIVSDSEFLRTTQLRPHHGPVKDLSFTVRIAGSRLNAEQDVAMELRSNDTVGHLQQVLHERLTSGAEDGAEDSLNAWKDIGLPPDCAIVLRRGSRLHKDACLQAGGITDGCFVQVFLIKDLPNRVLKRRE